MPLANICDCHIHVFEEGHALAPTATFVPPHAPASAYRAVQKAVGLERVLVVQPTGYGFDNRCTLQAMAELGPGARGIAVVPVDVSDAELERLHAAGMRGVRFMMLPGGVLPWDALEPLAARIAPLGWTINLQLNGRELPERETLLARLPARIVIDHVAKFNPPVPVDHASLTCLRRMLDAGNTWIKISAPYEVSQSGPPAYGDVAAYARLLVRHHTERCLWASNWPHPNVRPEPDVRNLLDWFLGLAGGEEGADAHRILVDNPAGLYGF